MSNTLDEDEDVVIATSSPDDVLKSYFQYNLVNKVCITKKLNLVKVVQALGKNIPNEVLGVPCLSKTVTDS